MTHAAPRRRRGKTWVLPAVAAGLVVAAVALDALSRAVFFDAVSWWPVWLVLAGLVLWGRDLKVGSLRLPGLVAVTTVAVIAAFVLGHLQGWAFMPSSGGSLSGSADQGYTSAALSARLPGGGLEVGVGAAGLLYDAVPIRRGGDVPLPKAVERSQDGSVSIELAAVDGPGWERWAGWSLSLSPTPVWTLTLEGDIDADLSGLALENLQVIGSGSVVVGPVTMSTPMTVAGDFVIDVPAGTPVRVIGPAEVPSDWVRSGTGATSPVEGQGWVISVAEGAIVQIRNR